MTDREAVERLRRDIEVAKGPVDRERAADIRTVLAALEAAEQRAMARDVWEATAEQRMDRLEAAEAKVAAMEPLVAAALAWESLDVVDRGHSIKALYQAVAAYRATQSARRSTAAPEARGATEDGPEGANG